MLIGHIQPCLEYSSFQTWSEQAMVTYGMEGARVQERSHKLWRAASGKLTLMCSRVSVSNSTSSLSISMSRG